jgi:sulfide:quinone oxidoreductase
MEGGRAERTVRSMISGEGALRPEPAGKRALIAGGGVAGLEAMLALRELASVWLEVELLTPERDFVYRPLAVAQPFGVGSARRFDLEALAHGVGAGYRADALASIDPERHAVRTRAGEEVAYDALVIACGARMREALPGAITFWGTGDANRFRTLLREIETGVTREVVFSLPSGGGWPLPLYELALLTAADVAQHGKEDAELTIATPEATPLELFGEEASAAMRELLEKRGIGLSCGSHPAEVDEEGLRLVPGGHLAADRVITIPRLEGPRLEGVPYDEDGFIPTDSFGLVKDLEEADVYAAGDATAFPVKQGGLAAQQADAVAESIAAEAGLNVDPQAFRPVLRGLLLTGSEPSYLRAEIAGGGESSVAASEPLWWPPGKIAGRYLGPHLASLGNTELHPAPPVRAGHVPVEVQLAR